MGVHGFFYITMQVSKINESKAVQIDIEKIVLKSVDPTKTIKCNCCNKMYPKKEAKFCFTNYGGAVRKLQYCSDDCVEQVISINPGRISLTKPKPTFLW